MVFLTNLNLNKNELQNAVLQPLAVAPSNPKLGQIYYNSSDKLVYAYDGSAWKVIGAVVLSVNGETGAVVLTQDDIGNGATYVRTHNDLTDTLVALINSSLQRSGGTMTGSIAMGSNKITGLANGTDNQDAVTKAQLDAAIIGSLKPSGSITFANLPALGASVLNNIYNITDAFTTTADFVEGVGHEYPAGTNVAIINTGTISSPVYKYDTYTGTLDLSPFIVRTGDTMSGNLAMGNNLITGLGAPTSDNDAASKKYVDDKELIAGAGIIIESQSVGLLPKYNNYLVRATFEKPVLSLTINGAAGAKEIGTPLTISTITHSETHADNIASGTLKFYRNGTEVQAIAPSALSATVTLDEAITEAGTSAGSVSYKLQCIDTLGDMQASNTITATWYRYVYSQVGDPETVPTSAENCVKQANLVTFAANGADFTYAVGKCIWLLTTNANAKIQTNVLGQWVDVTYYSGGSVTFTQENGATETYYAYRTDAFIGAGTAKYRITNP